MKETLRQGHDAQCSCSQGSTVQSGGGLQGLTLLSWALSVLGKGMTEDLTRCW